MARIDTISINDIPAQTNDFSPIPAGEYIATIKDAELKAIFTPIAEQLTANEAKIVEELLAVQGKPVDIGGYYQPNDALASAALRPSATFNQVINSL